MSEKPINSPEDDDYHNHEEDHKEEKSSSSTNNSSNSGNIDDTRGVYVGGLLPTVTEDDIRRLFAQYGKIVKLNFAYDQVMRVCKGYAFVQYESPDAAKTAIKSEHGRGITGVSLQLKVEAITPKAPKSEQTSQLSNLYITQLPLTYTLEDLNSLFSAFGKIVASRLLTNPATGGSRGSGFVKLDSSENARKAMEKMHNSVPPRGTEAISVRYARDKSRTSTTRVPAVFPYLRPELDPLFAAAASYYKPDRRGDKGYAYDPRVVAPYAPYASYGTPYGDPSDPTPRSRSNLYIANFPKHYTKDQLEAMFAPYGTIMTSRLLTEGDGSPRGIAFVRYEYGEQAARAMTALNGTIPSGHSAPLKIMFAKEKTSGSSGSSRGGPSSSYSYYPHE